MRKTFFILSILIISGFFLTALSTPPSTTVGHSYNKITADASVFADTLSWKLLGRIQYEKKPSKDYPEGVMYPKINSTLKTKNKKPIVMSGFIIPIDNKNYALSKNVFASCFFCGQAGPETIMGIKFKDPSIRLKTDQYVTLKGTFRYNDNDVDDWIYHIENAVIVKGD
ncbi:hypothetical protein DVK85_02855 [Flavobacterium arcticum]|uniref:DUF3299 domain-containing protein n=1 Tax=Flavobacterium arcticum TaxID=1784713 RepID=A0A345H9G3_9FLAO|nr:hypothetical protein [Flavobacterium arcticum]AXG73223.1 hypothetical protein DVK85_02855 [Flavobacterium arcticum]KAF2513016.1 hypothetical protein E0W72_00920 [Flavobacterium arcticum]